MKIKNNKGSIEVICGPMFSGKTEELICRVKNAKKNNAKLNPLVFKPMVDTRYSKSKVVSHNKNAIECKPIKNIREILSLKNKSKMIAIDEVQFFEKEVVFVCNQLANEGVRVVVSGLDMDFMGAPFGEMPYLIAISEKVTKMKALCNCCGNEAAYTHRKDREKKLILLGEEKKYEALCRSCFIKKNSK